MFNFNHVYSAYTSDSQHVNNAVVYDGHLWLTGKTLSGTITPLSETTSPVFLLLSITLHLYFRSLLIQKINLTTCHIHEHSQSFNSRLAFHWCWVNIFSNARARQTCFNVKDEPQQNMMGKQLKQTSNWRTGVRNEVCTQKI